ncbi:hypothetical protein [Idiomarina aminovorans]|uniref:hypothetical protein n=1 Tax=Idiomarina aminovorans TaxID=2914829 RepID=UPI002004FE36|nr:hypothetical protein [Idiomarina sp. ATCH4]MCK7460207.1 hypothetical protein [Idiomarina sp. ATCH4]
MSEQWIRRFFRKASKALLGIFLTNEDLPYTATEFRDRISHSRFRILIHALVGIFWLLLAYIIFISVRFLATPDTLYNVNATSEIITINSYKDSAFMPWKLESATRYSECGTDTSAVSGTLEIARETTLYLERVGTGSLWITLSSDTLAPAGELLNTAGERVELSDCEAFELPVSDINSYTLPIDGVMTLGGEVKEASTREPILHSGSVAISDKGALSRQYYQTDPYPLELGDKFYIKEPSVQSSGFIYVDSSPGIKATYSGKGDIGVIQRYKSEDVVLRNSIWTKLANDETLIVLWVFLVAAFSFLKYIMRVNIE